MTTRQKNHPFYCYKKNCRKTAWQTPEYLNKEDWEFLRQILPLININKGEEFYNFLYADINKAEIFFNRIIGWPEGFNYCKNIKYCQKTAIPGIIKHELNKLICACPI